MKRKYTVWGLSESAERLQFDIKDNASKRSTKTTVAQYFFDAYRIALRYVSMHTYSKLSQSIDDWRKTFAWWSYIRFP